MRAAPQLLKHHDLACRACVEWDARICACSRAFKKLMPYVAAPCICTNQKALQLDWDTYAQTY